MVAEDYAATLAWQVKAVGEVPTEREYRFHPERRWRFDLAFPAQMVAVEVDGGSWMQGRHTTGAGFAADCEKLSVAAGMGWRVLRVTPAQVRDGKALSWLQAALRYTGRAETPPSLERLAQVWDAAAANPDPAQGVIGVLIAKAWQVAAAELRAALRHQS